MNRFDATNLLCHGCSDFFCSSCPYSSLSSSTSSSSFFFFPDELEPKKLTYIRTKTRTAASQQKEQSRLQVANCEYINQSINQSISQ